MFYKPFSQNLKDGSEDDMAVDCNQGSLKKRDDSYNRGFQLSGDQRESMDIDEEVKQAVSPGSKLKEFHKLMNLKTSSLIEEDRKDLFDPHTCAEYAEEIHTNLKQEEMKYLP